jgi:DNA-directed RNA polymerase specialized sigma24 family protein
MNAPTDTLTAPEYPELVDIKTLTDLMRNHQKAIEDISKTRKTVILSLRRKRITYREIAAAMGVTEQSVYKILRDTIKAQKTL